MSSLPNSLLSSLPLGADSGQEPSPSALASAPPSSATSPPAAGMDAGLQSALRDLVLQYELECDAVRRQYVRRFREAEEFWRGNQNLYWGERDFRWHTPFEQALERGAAADLPRYDYVTNIYQAFGLSVIAAISQRIPRVRFQPVSTLNESDIATARAAALVAELIERNNHIDLLTIREAYLLWTQGMFGAYVRYVVDEEFGTHPEPAYAMTPTRVLAAGYLCPACGFEIPSPAPGDTPGDAPGDANGDTAGDVPGDAAAGPYAPSPASAPAGASTVDLPGWSVPPPSPAASDSAPALLSAPPLPASPAADSVAGRSSSYSAWVSSTTAAAADPGAFAAAGPLAGPPSLPACSACGEPLDAAAWHPDEFMDVPVVTGFQSVPNGQERISVYGGLNLKVMPFAGELRQSGYLILAEEQHVAALRAAYPAAAERISAGNAGAGETYERLSRLALLEPPGAPAGSLPYSSLVTYKRCWLRPWAFWAHTDPDIRRRLLELFPEGCMVAFAGDVFLEARPERLDDHWRICRAMPGAGMYTEPIGASIVSIQKRVNDLANIQAEHVEYGAAPPILYDARYINGQALANKRMEPASYTPVVIEANGGKPLADLIFQPRIGLDPSIYAQGQNLVELAQFLTGAFPAVFGGSMQDVSTATGYGMARQQALGRLSLFWRQIKQFHADLMLAAVNVFRCNRTQDVEQVLFHRSGDFASRFIHLGDLQGNVTVHPEADAFPVSWSDIRQNVLQLLQSSDPYIQNLLAHPLNAEQVKNYLGAPGFILPEDDNRSKQFRELDLLLRSEPVFDSARSVWLPTVPTDPLVDDHAVHLQTLREWAVSDDGISAKQANPAGYANAMAHLLQHQRDFSSAAAAGPPPAAALHSIRQRAAPPDRQRKPMPPSHP